MELINENFFSVGVPLMSSIIAAIISAIVSWLKTKFKNSDLIEVIPDAMLYAESIGGSGSIKMENALMYLRDKIKSFSEKQARKYIEEFITVSKTINKNKGVTNYDKSSTSIITR